MNADYSHTIFEYNMWAHRSVWGCIQHLSDAQFVQDLDYSIGSIRNQVVHVMSVDRRWFARITGNEMPPHLKVEDFSSKEAALTRWKEIEAQNHATILSLDDASVSRVLDYDLPHRGGMKHDAVWQIIAHVVNHGTDHRAQILAMLHRLGAPTVEQDMMFYLWDKA